MTNKGRKFPPEPLTADEAQALIDVIKGNGPLAMRNRALLALLWRSGVRVSEALALKPADVDLDRGSVRVLNGKGRKDRVSAIDSRATGHLRAWLAVRAGLGLNGRQPLFCTVSDGPNKQVGRALNPAYLRQLLPKLAARAGIDKRVHPHGLRHTHAAELLQRGAPLGVISGQLGHTSVVTTNTYLQKVTGDDVLAGMRAAGFTLERAAETR
ncbi:MAG: tyrosine recombinase XerC [Solirubrobacterales bacterium]|nr:tyrosine recombinase XerC [Solirubrobacterales bacterium]